MNNYSKRMNYQVSTAAAADVGTPRSKWYMPHTRKTTFNVGDLIPVGAPWRFFPAILLTILIPRFWLVCQLPSSPPWTMRFAIFRFLRALAALV